ncbi:hypothetical protein [Phenylobacterium sp.]|jgi:hypothetical protein
MSYPDRPARRRGAVAKAAPAPALAQRLLVPSLLSLAAALAALVAAIR